VAAYRCPRPIVLRNSFPLQPRTRPDSAGRSPSPVFIWFSQTIGPGRGLEAFLAAWAETKNPSQVILLGHDRPGYRAHLLGRLPEQRRADVSFRAPVKPDELPAELANHDVGLALEPALPRNKDVTISNKVFQYLNAGLALVATPTAGQQEIMHAAPGCGLVIDPSDPRAVARQLDALLGDPDRLRAMQVASRHAAERELSWEHDSRRLLAAVADALSPHPPTID
jgi:glycosyltransferase involved in cell wall biosynthesis